MKIIDGQKVREKCAPKIFETFETIFLFDFKSADRYLYCLVDFKAQQKNTSVENKSSP